MNNYKSFSDLKEELGNNYDFKLYEMGISALKKIENLQQENKQLKGKLDCDLQWAFKYEKQVNNWNIIKQEILKIRQSTFSKYNSNEWDNCLSFNDDIEPILDKMKELEGSDSNEI